jgi:hypothetical protein
MMAEQQNRDRKNKEREEEERDVLELPAHYYRPFRIGGVMHDRPKQTAAAKGEKIKEAEQPGETELRLILQGANQTEQEPDNSAARQQQRQATETIRFKIFTLRGRYDLRTLAHFFCASGLGAGLVSGGLASAFSSFANSSGGTSAAAAFWLRCKART